jgi:hypothetical protein
MQNGVHAGRSCKPSCTLSTPRAANSQAAAAGVVRALTQPRIQLLHLVVVLQPVPSLDFHDAVLAAQVLSGILDQHGLEIEFDGFHRPGALGVARVDAPIEALDAQIAELEDQVRLALVLVVGELAGLADADDAPLDLGLLAARQKQVGRSLVDVLGDLERVEGRLLVLGRTAARRVVSPTAAAAAAAGVVLSARPALRVGALFLIVVLGGRDVKVELGNLERAERSALHAELIVIGLTPNLGVLQFHVCV